jgi:hypothetical protein
MAQMIPSAVKNFHGSKGEEDVFRALRKLSDHPIRNQIIAGVTTKNASLTHFKVDVTASMTQIIRHGQAVHHRR